MRSRGAIGLGSSPTLVGAVTVLIAILAVFLAYNANSGLPFVPSYRVTAQVPNASTLMPGNEVRVGGVRVGLVESIEPVQHGDGSVSATLELKLDKDVEPIPRDSTLNVRSRSALGLKYLEINRGSADEGYEEGSVIPLRAAKDEPVEFDEFLSTFDEPTQVAIQENLFEFGNALAGRGPALNDALGALDPVVRRLEPVMRNLGASRTALSRFVRALSATASEVAPVARQQADMFAALDTTFAALADVATPYIQETISESPPTLEQGTRSLPVIRPFLDHSAALFADLEPGVEALRVNSPTIASALQIGTPVLRAAPRLNRELGPTARALERLNDDAAARAGIDRLTQTSDFLTPLLRFVGPSQTVCNYPYLLLRNAAELFGQGDGIGTWQRFVLLGTPEGPNSETGPSSAPAAGGGPTPTENFLHTNPYPNTAAPGQTFECEAGNEPYAPGRQVIGNVPGNQGTRTEDQR